MIRSGPTTSIRRARPRLPAPSTRQSPPSPPIGEALEGLTPSHLHSETAGGGCSGPASQSRTAYHPVTGSSRGHHDQRRTGEVLASPLAPLAGGESERTMRSCRNTKVRSCVVADRSSIRGRMPHGAHAAWRLNQEGGRPWGGHDKWRARPTAENEVSLGTTNRECPTATVAAEGVVHQCEKSACQCHPGDLVPTPLLNAGVEEAELPLLRA